MVLILSKKRGFSGFPARESLLLFFLLLVSLVHSQNYSCTDLFSSSEGLSQSTVNCIIQDNDGFLWIGTQDGLNLYDGNNISFFHNIPGDSTSLSDNYILGMCETPDGYIWIGTMSGGINRFDKKHLNFQSFQNEPDNDKSISDNTIWCIESDSSGNIWAGTRFGLNCLNTKNYENVRFTAEDSINSLPANMVISLFRDSNNKLWIGTTSGLASINLPDKTITKLQSNDNISQLSFWSAFEDVFGVLYFGTTNGIWKIKNGNQKLEKINVPQINSTVWSIYGEPSGKLWIGTRNGFYHYDNTKGSSQRLDYEKGNQKIGDNTNIWCQIKDYSGVFWVGTDEGMLKMKKESHVFDILNTQQENDLFLSGPSVMSIMQDRNDNLWIGTDGWGLNFKPKDKSLFQVFKTDPESNNSISSNNVWSLIEDKEGLIWIGTYGGGLNSFDKKTQSFKSFLKNDLENSISNNRVLALHEDHDGKIWLGTRGGGLNCYNKETDKFEVYMYNPQDSTSLPSNTVLSIIDDQWGTLWIGTYQGGLSKFIPETNSFINYCAKPGEPYNLSNDNVWSLLSDSQGKLWVGTQGGLHWCDSSIRKDPKFYHLSSRHGLPNNVIFGLNEDNHGNIWMSTFRGIAVLEKNNMQRATDLNEENNKNSIDPFNPVIKAYTETDGIHGNEFNAGSHFKSNDGIIYFGGLTGMTSFHPDSLYHSEFNPKVVLTGFKIFNKEVEILATPMDKKNSIQFVDNKYYIPQKITYLKNLNLTYRESVFSFSFASLDFNKPQSNNYTYIMEGFETEWNYVGHQQSATYTNLDPGEYVFRVKATNSDEIWSMNEAVLKLSISPPFWKTTWFISLMILIVLSIFVLSIFQFLRIQKKRAFAEKEKIELQLKTIKNQMDPHFAFNALNMIGALVYKNDPDTVYDYFSRFAKLIRSTLQDSAKIARPLNEEIEFVNNYIEIQKTRFKGKFDYQIEIDKKVNLDINVPKMIIQTFVENAIKHGLMHKEEKGLLSITINENSDKMTIEITDDGIGRKKAAEFSKTGTQKGMQIVQQIFSMYNKLNKHRIFHEIVDLRNSHGNACGTKVILIIEMKNEYE